MAPELHLSSGATNVVAHKRELALMRSLAESRYTLLEGCMAPDHLGPQ